MVRGLALAACFVGSGSLGDAAPAIIDLADVRQTIRGFGGATVFQPPAETVIQPLQDADLDALFGTGPGQIGLTLMRIRVAADDSWRALELGNALGAKARGADVIATPWSPPASMKSNNSLIGGSLNTSSYGDYARYLNDFAKYMASNGASLYAISIQNEPDYSVTYESCDWTPAEMLDFCRNFAGAITATRVIAPESYQFRRAISDPILQDEIATAQVDIIGGHIYGGGLTAYPLAVSKGREVWMTEHLDLSTDWAGALATAREIHDCMATAGFNAYIWWYLKRYYGPLGEDGVVTKRGHVMAQFSKFIRPTYVRVGATANPATGVHVSAYKRERLVIVAVNQGGAPVVQSFQLQHGTVPSVTPWVTSSTLSMAVQPAISVSGGEFSATLAPGSVTTFVGDLPLAAPSIVAPPRSHTIETGSAVFLEVSASGDFVSYQWSRDGVSLPGATRPGFYIDAAQPGDAGAYAVTVSNSGGSVTSPPAILTVAVSGDPGRLVNISARSSVGLGDAVPIGGFVIEGAAPKPMLVRAAGPALAEFHGVSGALVDPVVDLVEQASGVVVAGNDDWEAALAPSFRECGAFRWSLGSKDAAMVASLPPGAYTAVVRSATDSPGVALVEIYEFPGDAAGPEVVNLSSRAQVGVDDDVQIAGFVIGGSTARTVLIRASGPALAQIAGLQGTLADPVVDLRNQANGDLLASADDWDASGAGIFRAVGAFAWSPDSKDAALIVTLDPGSYTAIVRGKDRGTGIALVEVYALP